MITILNERELSNSLTTICNKILTLKKENIVLLGIDIQGKILAKRISEQLKKKKNLVCKVGQLDVTLFKPIEENSYMNLGYSEIPFSLKNKTVILVAPMVISGKTMSAALVALNDYDVPESIKCCCILSSQNLNRPISTELIGNVDIKAKTSFYIKLFETDGEDLIFEKLS